MKSQVAALLHWLCWGWDKQFEEDSPIFWETSWLNRISIAISQTKWVAFLLLTNKLFFTCLQINKSKAKIESSKMSCIQYWWNAVWKDNKVRRFFTKCLSKLAWKQPTAKWVANTREMSEVYNLLMLKMLRLYLFFSFAFLRFFVD